MGGWQPARSQGSALVFADLRFAMPLLACMSCACLLRPQARQVSPAGLKLPLGLCPPRPFPSQRRVPTPQPPPLLQRADLSKLFPGASPLAVDLLGRMLQFDPRRRISVEEALAHPWLAQLHDEAAEPAAQGGRARVCWGCWGCL